MSHKQRPRLGSAIASTILSLFSAASLVGVDKAQAAVLTYKINLDGQGSGFLKVDNSSLTGIDFERIAVSEGKLYGFTFPELGSKKQYDNLVGATAIFAQGDFLGLYASGSDSGIRDHIIPPDEPDGPWFLRVEGSAYWSIGVTSGSWSRELVHRQVNYQSYIDDGSIITESYVIYSRYISSNAEVSYTLVDTEAEPVPEPLTAGAAALALAGLSWLKHKKKMAA